MRKTPKIEALVVFFLDFFFALKFDLIRPPFCHNQANSSCDLFSVEVQSIDMASYRVLVRLASALATGSQTTYMLSLLARFADNPSLTASTQLLVQVETHSSQARASDKQPSFSSMARSASLAIVLEMDARPPAPALVLNMSNIRQRDAMPVSVELVGDDEHRLFAIGANGTCDTSGNCARTIELQRAPTRPVQYEMVARMRQVVAERVFEDTLPIVVVVRRPRVATQAPLFDNTDDGGGYKFVVSESVQRGQVARNVSLVVTDASYMSPYAQGAGYQLELLAREPASGALVKSDTFELTARAGIGRTPLSFVVIGELDYENGPRQYNLVVNINKLKIHCFICYYNSGHFFLNLDKSLIFRFY